MRSVSDKSCRENQNTHLMFKIIFRKPFPFWDNVEKYGWVGQAKDWYDMIYLLTAIGLSPCGSITVHIYTQTIHRTIQNKQYIE